MGQRDDTDQLYRELTRALRRSILGSEEIAR
jgi:hypothetical protein